MPSGQFCTKNTLCWSCQHAVPNYDGTRGCSWSREGKPVEGWDADPTVIRGYRYTDDARSYHVKACPQFLEDEEREPEA